MSVTAELLFLLITKVTDVYVEENPPATRGSFFNAYQNLTGRVW